MGDDNYLVLALFVGAVVLTGSSGAIFRPGEWYERIRKPSWRPPNWLFAPVWFVLYAMIAYSGYLVWREFGGWTFVALPLTVYIVQLVLNWLWSALFFGLRQPGLAFLGILLLWGSIYLTIQLFWDINETAAYLLMPYLAWVSFAAILNFAIYWMNSRDDLRAARAAA